MLHQHLLDTIYNNKETLISYPNSLDRWMLSFLLLSGWKNYNIVIVTDHPEEFSSILEKEINDWTQEELILFPHVKYSNLSELNTYLHNTEVDIIFFDDARMLSIISPALDLSNVSPKIVILSTWGDNYHELSNLFSFFPNMQLLSFDSNDNRKIDWNFYNAEDKLLTMLDNAISDSNSKQIIFSKSNIMKMVEYLKYRFPGQIFYVACGDNFKLNHQVCSKFAESHDGILVTCIIPSVIMKEISTIHIVDNYYFPLLKLLLDKCTKENLVNICSYITNNDMYCYTRLVNDLTAADDFFEQVVNQSTKITY